MERPSVSLQDLSIFDLDDHEASRDFYRKAVLVKKSQTYKFQPPVPPFKQSPA